MTRWQVAGLYGGCTVNGYQGDYVINSDTGQNIGIYVDDSDGTVSDRESLITCAYDNGWRVILAGMGFGETTVLFNEPDGTEPGEMLEWYPYPNGSTHTCNPQRNDSTNPPSISSIYELGFILQQNFLWTSTCTPGPTTTQHNNMFFSAWGQLNGTYDLELRPGTDVWYVGPYGDLIGNY